MMISNLPEKLHPALEEHFTNNPPGEQSKAVAGLLKNLQKREEKVDAKVSSYNLNPSSENLNQVKKIARKILNLLKEDFSLHIQNFDPELLSSYKKQLKSLQERLIQEDQIIETEEISDWEAPTWDPKSLEDFDKAVEKGETAIREDLEKAIDFYVEALSLARLFKDKSKTLQAMKRLAKAYMIPQEEPLDKQQRKLIQTAGMYNYCLQLASEEEKGAIKQELAKIEQTLLDLCGAKSQEQDSFDANRTQLKKFRKEIAGKIQKLPEETDPQKVFKLYHQIAEWMKGFTIKLIKQAIEESSEPLPCSFAVIGFGSLAREEMTPYSDLECGILIEKDENRQYFKNLACLLHLKIVNLGETILPALNIPPLRDFYDDIILRGFSFDGEGVQGKGCKTPFGNRKTFELIQTPEKMAQYIGKDDDGEWWFEKEPQLPMELLNYTPILDASKLSERYGSAIQRELMLQVDEEKSLREYLAKIHLVQEDRKRFDLNLESGDDNGKLFHVKQDLYRSPHLLIDRLAILNKTDATCTVDRIEKLQPLCINEEAAKRLKYTLSKLIEMRLKVYAEKKAQNDQMNPLLYPFRFDDQKLVKKEFQANHKIQDELRKIFRVLVPFHAQVNDYLDGKLTSVLGETFQENSSFFKGLVECRLLLYRKAEKYFLQPDLEASKDPAVLQKLAETRFQLGDSDKALEYVNKVLGVLDNEKSIRTATALMTKGKILHELAEHGEAITFTQDSLKIMEGLSGEHQRTEVACHRNIAAMLQALGRFEEALKEHAAAIELIPKSHSDDLGIALNNLGSCYHEFGRYKEAHKKHVDAANKWRKLYGTNHLHFAYTHNNIGANYLVQRQDVEAINHFSEALAIRKNNLGELHPLYATTLSNIGEAYVSKGQFSTALHYSLRAKEIRLCILGKNHPDVGLSFNSIAGCYLEMGEKNQAESYQLKALEVFEKQTEGPHRHLHYIWNAIGLIYIRLEDFDKSKEYLDRALDSAKILYKTGHPSIADCHDYIGTLKKERGEPKLALIDYNRSLEMRREFFGERHPNTAQSLNNIGTCHYAMEDMESALGYHREALEIIKKFFGSEHIEVGIISRNIGECLVQIAGKVMETSYQEGFERYQEALNNYQKAKEIFISVYGEIHLKTAGVFVEIGNCYKAQQEYDLAIESYKRVLNIRTSLNDLNGINFALSGIGEAYFLQGNSEAALSAYQQALSTLEEISDNPSVDKAAIHNCIGASFNALGKEEKALESFLNEHRVLEHLEGENQLLIAESHYNIGCFAYETQNLQMALDHSRNALKIWKPVLGDQNQEVLDCQSKIQIIQQKLSGGM